MSRYKKRMARAADIVECALERRREEDAERCRRVGVDVRGGRRRSYSVGDDRFKVCTGEEFVGLHARVMNGGMVRVPEATNYLIREERNGKWTLLGGGLSIRNLSGKEEGGVFVEEGYETKAQRSFDANNYYAGLYYFYYSEQWDIENIVMLKETLLRVLDETVELDKDTCRMATMSLMKILEIEKDESFCMACMDKGLSRFEGGESKALVFLCAITSSNSALKEVTRERIVETPENRNRLIQCMIEQFFNAELLHLFLGAANVDKILDAIQEDEQMSCLEKFKAINGLDDMSYNFLDKAARWLDVFIQKKPKMDEKERQIFDRIVGRIRKEAERGETSAAITCLLISVAVNSLENREEA